MNVGDSNQITRNYLDSLLIETRYMNSDNPNLELRLYGKVFPSPIMTAALSHLDKFMFEGATEAYVEGTSAADAVLWLGMADEKEVEFCAKHSKAMVEIIKPYKNRDLIYSKIEHAENNELLAVGIDIDHPFGADGSPDIVDGHEMKALTTGELEKICKAANLPVIIKGVLSRYDAVEAVSAGAGGIVLSHHNNRIEYAIPPLAILPEIRETVPADFPIFVDCEIRTGMDAFKALVLGATAVCIGRPLMTAIRQSGSQGVKEYLEKANAELGKAMAFTGCTSLGKMDPSVVRRLYH